MPKLDYTTITTDFNVSAREIDFVTRFGRNWQALQDVMGIMRPIRKEPGAVLKQKVASITLQSGNVNEGDLIPFSEAQVTEIPYEEMSLEKYAKSVSIESIKEFGYDVAIAKTDDAFLTELQMGVMNKFYTYLKTGQLTNTQVSFQKALAIAKGLVLNKFKAMHKDCSDVVAFVNTIDVYTYLGDASISVQTAFGFTYIQNFMGYKTVFLCGDAEIPRGKVIACPVENIVLYYVDPSTDDFAKACLVFTTAGETNLIGFHTEGDYTRATSNCFALLGLTLFAEFIDGIAVVTIEASGSLDALTVTSGAGTTDTGSTKLTVNEIDGASADKKFYFKADDTAAPSVTYLEQVDLTGWTQITAKETDNFKPTGLASGDKATVIAINGSGQAVAKGNADIVVKA